MVGQSRSQAGIGMASESGARSTPVRAFISYAHDTPDHTEAARKLWLLLRRCGIDARIDLTAAEHPQDWTLWMLEQVRDADYVLVVGSPAYRRRAEGTEQPGTGRGAQWEAALIRDAFLADRAAARQRFLPVLLPGGSADDIPAFFGPASGTWYRVDEFSQVGIERLVRVLTGQPFETEPPLGAVPVLSKRPLLDLADFVPRIATFARFQFDVYGTGVGRGIDPGQAGSILPDLYPLSQEAPEAFVEALASAVRPIGGWAAYGGYLLLWEFNLSVEYEASRSLIEGGLRFLRDNGVPPSWLADRDWDHWLRGGGTLDTWLPRLPTPTLEAAPISALGWRETKRIAQLTPEADSNQVLVRRAGRDGAFVALIDYRKSEQDSKRAERAWKTAESLYELYVGVALALQVPPYWCDRELEPYFPLPRPTIQRW